MIVVDMESSGLNPESMSLLSIGAIDFNDPSNRFYQECRVWDGALMEEGAMKFHGFSKDQMQDRNKQSEADLIKNFIAWALKIEDRTLSGHAFWLDYAFLTAAARRAGIFWPLGYKYVDTHSVAYSYFLRNDLEIPFRDGISHLNLPAISRFVNIPELPLPHNALTDALSTAEAYSRLVFGKSLLPEFKDHSVPSILKQ